MTKAVRVTNNSVVDCAFSWSFLEDVDEVRLGATTRRPYIPVNQIFDILPIRSFLRPGESEEVCTWWIVLYFPSSQDIETQRSWGKADGFFGPTR